MRIQKVVKGRTNQINDVEEPDDDDDEDLFTGDPADSADALILFMRDILEGSRDIEEIWHATLMSLRQLEHHTSWGSLTLITREVGEIAEAYIGDTSKPKPRPGPRWARHFQEKLLTRLDQLLAKTPVSERIVTLRQNVGMMAGIFNLSPAEERLLAFCATIARNFPLQRIVDEILRSARTDVRMLRALTGASPEEAVKIMDGKTAIVRAGLIYIEDDEDDFSETFVMRAQVSAVIQREHDEPAALLQGLLRPAPESQIRLEDVGHLKEKIDAAMRVLTGSCASGATGVNILLYGPPGTGKTETARLLCETAGLKAYMIGEMEDEDLDLSREDRIADFRTAQSLLERDRESVCIFDEMEDLTTFDIGEASKIFMNRLLEENATPVIWIANNLRAIPDVLIRRMSFAFEVPVPPAKVQKSMLRDMANQMKIPLEDSDIDAMQKLTQVVPAVARNALRAAQLAGGGVGEAKLAWQGLNEALRGAAFPAVSKTAQDLFRPEMSVADTDLIQMADRLADRGASRVSFCFYGLPGTGKSAFARYLSDRMGVRTIEKRGSDILGSYVGETEKNIALAFEQARDEGAALIFDEIDSLLTSRSNHVRSWETSQVNELLKALEDHPAPVFGCTNLVENLDQAALRRFLFRVKFKALTPDKARHCFEHYLGMAPPASLDEVTGLVPADFGLVKARVEILGISDLEEMVRLLGEEAKSRSPESRPIGFGRSLHA